MLMSIIIINNAEDIMYTIIRTLFLLIISTHSFAVIEFDQNITPDVIFGSGNANGSFTTSRNNGIEVGIRAKIPFVGTVNSNGDGTYSYTLVEAATAWNFDYSINTNFDGSTGLNLDQFTYELGLDSDPGLGTNYLIFDNVTPNVAPLNAPFYDHSIGDNSTANGMGTEATDNATYTALLANNNVLQQSWRYAFFTIAPLDTYDVSIPGTYAVYLLARDSGGTVVSRVDIQVLIGGAPAVLPPATPVPALNNLSFLLLVLLMLIAAKATNFISSRIK